MTEAEVRPLSSIERDVLAALLSHDFVGVEALRVQARDVLASEGCACGCGTISLQPQGNGLPRSSARSPADVSGVVYNDADESLGGVLLFMRDGLLSSLEVYAFVDPVLAMPEVSHVKWH